MPFSGIRLPSCALDETATVNDRKARLQRDFRIDLYMWGNHSMIFLVELQPILLAPASIMASACSRVRTPPLALTPSSEPTVFRMSAISSVVAPPVENPVEVFTNAAPAAFAARQAFTFSSSVSRQVSMMTLTMAGFAALTTAAEISACTADQSPALPRRCS